MKSCFTRALFLNQMTKSDIHKLVLNTINSVHLICIENILYCKSDNSYTTFYLTDQEPIIISKNIKEFEKQLCRYRFFRPHQSYLVNIDHIRKVDKQNGYCLQMSDASNVPTSSRKRRELLQILQSM